MNSTAVALTGFAIRECVGIGLELFQNEVRGNHSSLFGLLRRVEQVGSIQADLTIVHRNGGLLPVFVWISKLVLSSVADGTSFLAIVPSERTNVPQSISRESSRGLSDNARQIMLALVADGIITADHNGKITYLNPAAERLTGWSSGEALGRPEHEVFCVLAMATENFDASVSTRYSDSTHQTLQSRNGIQHDISLTITPILDTDTTITGTIITFRDITANRQTEEALKRHVSLDPLTNLINRYEFERKLGSIFEQLQNHDHHALLYIDLDRFKVINDTCSHSAGDELLRDISKLISEKVRTTDIVARLGADEFAILLEKCSIGDAQRCAHQILWAIESFAFEWSAKKFKLTASIGVASLALGQDVATALSIVDRACQFAKDQGRNRVYVYQENDRDLSKRVRQMGWIPRIQEALAQNRFRLYLQPIVPLGCAFLTTYNHYEVLLRLIDEQDRLVLPGAFIPAAERYDQMAAIDRWVLQAALQTAQGQEHAESIFSLNLSGQSIGREDFLHFALNEIECSNIDPARICFEITESTAIDNFDRAIRLISTLRQRGCRFALDDFGVGISSLSYLKRLQVDFLKIDGSFIRGVTKTSTDLALVKAIQQVAQTLGIQTVAECIEDQETMDILTDLSIDFGQGYFIGMPSATDAYGKSAQGSLHPRP